MNNGFLPIDDRRDRLGQLFSMLEPAPEAWREKQEKAKANGVVGDDLEPVLCVTYRELVDYWRKAMKWTNGLDHGLAASLAVAMSTNLVGDQVWIKLIGPASCGKSTICEALSVSKKYVLAKSTMRGFHSGYDSGDGDEDHSLIAKVNGKTLVTKDGDTLLQSPNLSQILSEARDIFDTTSRTSYRNKQSRDYCNIRMTWILAGTSSLRSIDASELGERFLDCVIMEAIDDDLEDIILQRVAHRADRNTTLEVNGEAATQQEPEMIDAMAHTGGYVEYLRENAADLVARVTLTDESRHLCTRLGKFVAYMRARPSKLQDESAEREFSARLVSQLVRLAKCLAAVLNRKQVDEIVMRRVRQIALDTARGQALELARRLRADDGGQDIRALALLTNRTENDTKLLLRFMKRIGAVENFTTKSKAGILSKVKWRLTPRIVQLYDEVHGEPRTVAN